MSNENCISGTVILGEITCDYRAQLFPLQEDFPTHARIAQVLVSPVNGDGAHPIYVPTGNRTRIVVTDKAWVERGILEAYRREGLFRSLIESSIHHQLSTARP